MKGMHFTIGLIGKSSFLPLCVMAPGCYAYVYETQYRARHLGIIERAGGNCKQTCCSAAYDVYDRSTMNKFYVLVLMDVKFARDGMKGPIPNSSHYFFNALTSNLLKGKLNCV